MAERSKVLIHLSWCGMFIRRTQNISLIEEKDITYVQKFKTWNVAFPSLSSRPGLSIISISFSVVILRTDNSVSASGIWCKFTIGTVTVTGFWKVRFPLVTWTETAFEILENSLYWCAIGRTERHCKLIKTCKYATRKRTVLNSSNAKCVYI